MITRMIVVSVPKDKTQEAQRIWKQECAPLMIQQPGCLGEQLLRNRENASELISLQTWKDQQAVDQYRASPAHQDILKHTRGLMGVSKVEVKSYEVVG